jgi:hypothetical protein
MVTVICVDGIISIIIIIKTVLFFVFCLCALFLFFARSHSVIGLWAVKLARK